MKEGRHVTGQAAPAMRRVQHSGSSGSCCKQAARRGPEGAAPSGEARRGTVRQQAFDSVRQASTAAFASRLAFQTAESLCRRRPRRSTETKLAGDFPCRVCVMGKRAARAMQARKAQMGPFAKWGQSYGWAGEPRREGVDGAHRFRWVRRRKLSVSSSCYTKSEVPRAPAISLHFSSSVPAWIQCNIKHSSGTYLTGVGREDEFQCATLQ